MSRSDSDIDLEKFMPSAEEALKQADHAAAEERLRKAFADPELRAMLAAEGRAVEFTPVPPAPAATGDADSDEAAERRRAMALNHAMEIDPRSLEKVRRMDPAQAARAAACAGPKRSSPPSPSTNGSPRSAAVDAAALPSVHAPEVQPVTRPTKPMEHAAVTSVQPRAWWTPGRKSAAAIVAAFLPAMIVFLLFVKPQQPSVEQSATAVASTAPAALTVEAVAVAAAAAPRSATPSAEPTPTVAPSSSAAASATASAAAPATARTATTAPKQPRSSGDPREAAPSPSSVPTVQPQATVEPQPTAAPKASETPPPPSTSAPFLIRKKEP